MGTVKNIFGNKGNFGKFSREHGNRHLGGFFSSLAERVNPVGKFLQGFWGFFL